MCMLLCLMASPSNDHGDTWGVCCHVNRRGACVTTSAERRRLFFSSLLVGLSVCLLATGKMHERISMNFSGYVEQDPRNNLKNFGVLCFTPSIQARSCIEVYSSLIRVCYIFFFFQGNPCLLATLRENGWADFHEIFRKDGTWDKEQPETFSCRGD